METLVDIRFEVLMAMNLDVSFLVVMQRGFLGTYQRAGETYCLHLEGHQRQSSKRLIVIPYLQN
jgi:hypothetical protein